MGKKKTWAEKYIYGKVELNLWQFMLCMTCIRIIEAILKQIIAALK
jgi:hypothetical protein